MLNDESRLGGIAGKEPDCHDFHSCAEIKGQSDQSDQIISLRGGVQVFIQHLTCSHFTTPASLLQYGVVCFPLFVRPAAGEFTR
jgi:hypothetical protein